MQNPLLNFNMKIQYILLIIFCILLNCKSPANGIELKKLTKNSPSINKVKNDSLKAKFATDIIIFINAYNDGDLELFCNMIYPKLFELQSKEEMIKLMERVQNNGMNIKSEFQDIEKISNLVFYKNEVFCRIYYHIVISVKLSGELLKNKDKFKLDVERIYGKDNFVYEDKTSSFFIEAKKSMFAISSKGSGVWKYLEYNEEDEKTTSGLIPLDILEEIGK